MTITIEKAELHEMMIQAAKIGAMNMFNDIATYHLRDAARILGVSYNTLQKRIAEGKIRVIDGRITGAEISRYLKIK